MMRAVPWILVLVLLGFNVALLNQNRLLKASAVTRTAPVTTLLARSTLPIVELQDAELRTQSIASVIPASGHALVILFSPSDCPSCLEERKLWQEIPRTCGIPAVGLASNPSSREFWNWLRNLDLRIPVFLDTTGVLVDSLDPRQMPIKLLVHSTGTIVWADPPRMTPVESESFCDEVRSVLSE